MKELFRIIDKWTLTLIVIVCCITSVLFFKLNQKMEYDNYSVSSQTVYKYYNQMLEDYYDNLNTMDDEQACVQARVKLYRYYKELKENKSSLQNQYVPELSEIYEALKLYDESFSYVKGYKDMIDTYIAQGDAMLITDIYSNPNSFSHTNILKSKYDFRNLYNIRVKPDNSKAIETVVSSSSYVNIFILFIVLVCVFRFTSERKNGLIYIISASKQGRGVLAFKRILILGFTSVFSTLVVYICQFAVAFHIYGGWEYMSNSIQSWSLYGTICSTDSKWIYILLLMVLSAMSVFMTGIMVWLLISLSRNATIAMGIAVVLLSISYMLHNTIPIKSIWAILRTINIWSVILPADIISNYGNIGIGTFIIEKNKMLLLLNVIGGAVFSIGCILAAVHIRTVRKSGILDVISKKVYSMEQKLVTLLPQLMIELYKILWLQKGLIILFIVLIIVAKSGIRKGYVYDENMIVAIDYYKEADSMELSNELNQIVQKYENKQKYWEDKLKNITIAINNNTGEYSREDFSEASMQTSLYKYGVDEIHRNIENLKNLEARGIQGKVTSPFAVEEMLGENLFEHHRLYGLLSVIGLIFLLFGILSDERRQNMKVLINTAAYGRGKWFLNKSISAIIVTIILWGVIFIPNIINVVRTYDVWGKAVIIQDYPILSHISVKMSLDTYLVCILLWKLLILVSIAGIIVLISSIFNYLNSIIVAFGMLITHILYMIGFDPLYNFSIVSTMMVSENWSRNLSQINGIVIIAIGVICWGISVYKEAFGK